MITSLEFLKQMRDNMNVLLVRAKPHKNTINLQSFMICEPLELEYVSSYLESFGHSVEIIDMILEKKNFGAFLVNKSIDVVGFTSYLPHVNIIKEYARTVKDYDQNIKTVVGGIQAEVIPQDFIDENIDFIIKVNGLKTSKEILANLEKDQEKEIIKNKIAGVYTPEKKEYLIDTHFNYPFPDRTKTRKYRDRYNYIYHEKCATLKTSFGCPYQCEFCFCTEITGHQYFARDIENVIEEIKTIEEENIFIVDDNFLVDIGRIKKFCELMKQSNLHKNFILFGRADFIAENEEIIKMLKDCGLQAVFIGIESFKEKELENFNKKITVEMNIRAVQVLENMGLDCYSGIIVGMDWEKKDFDHLINFLNGFKHPMINVQPITPIPGTPIYEKLKEQIIIPRERYELWDMAHLLLQPTRMSKSRFYYHILRTYYQTSVSLRAHRYILKKYGLKVYLRTLKGALHITLQYLKLILAGEE